jgi:FG-GAP repeat
VIDGSLILAGAFGTTFNDHPGTGAAFVFVEPPAGWRSEHESQELAASDGAGGDSFGQTVAFSNGTAFVASPGANSPGTMNRQGFIYAFGSFPTAAVVTTPSAPDGSNGWFRHPVNIAVSAADLASPVAAIRCVLDPAGAPLSFGALPASCAFPAPAGASVATNGQHTVYAAAMNAAGYAGTSTSHVFRIDTVGPRLVCSPSPNFTVHGRGGLVTATVSDATSGAAAPIVAARANVRSAGKKTVTLTGHDNAGNAGTVKCRYTVTAPRVAAGFVFSFTGNSARFKIITALTAKKVRRGAKIKLDCKGRGCPFAHRTVNVPTTRLVCKRHHKHCTRKPAPALQNINLGPLLANRHLAVHTVLTASAFAPNTIRVTSTFKILANGVPVTTKCLAPGSKKAFSC